MQQEKQMFNWSIFPILTGILWSHLFYILNHRECLGDFMPLHNRVTVQVLAFSEPCDPGWRASPFKVVSICRSMSCVSSCQVWIKSVVSIWTQANLKHTLFKITKVEFSLLNHVREKANKQKSKNKNNLSINRPAHHCTAAYKILSKSVRNLARKWVQNFQLSHRTVTFNEGKDHAHWYQSTQLAVSIITSSLKEIDLKMSKCKSFFKVSSRLNSLLTILIRLDKMKMRLTLNLLVSAVKPFNSKICSCQDWTKNGWILFWKLKVLKKLSWFRQRMTSELSIPSESVGEKHYKPYVFHPKCTQHVRCGVVCLQDIKS